MATFLFSNTSKILVCRWGWFVHHPFGCLGALSVRLFQDVSIEPADNVHFTTYGLRSKVSTASTRVTIVRGAATPTILTQTTDDGIKVSYHGSCC